MQKAKNIPASSLVDNRDLNLQHVCGTWYVMRTTLHFWKTRRNPRFIYTQIKSPSFPRMLDVTRYGKLTGKQTNITGIDTQDATLPKVFHWRGNQWYSHLLTSNWCILDHDDTYQEWMIIYFSATPFTQAGIDICARSTSISDAKLHDRIQWIASNEQLGANFAQSFFAPQHDAEKEA